MITLNDSDKQVVLAYKKQIERGRGYNGLCFVDVNKLLEIHKVSVLLVSWSMINNAMGGKFKGFQI